MLHRALSSVGVTCRIPDSVCKLRWKTHPVPTSQHMFSLSSFHSPPQSSPSSSQAVPKSIRTTVPSQSNMIFSGLISLCAIPSPCSCAKATRSWNEIDLKIISGMRRLSIGRETDRRDKSGRSSLEIEGLGKRMDESSNVRRVIDRRGSDS